MNKTEYREYISSEAWQKRRKEVLRQRPRCERCFLPRSLSVRRGVYDQDLHVHHKSYAHIGAELDEELEVLCARCHEIETCGSSALHWGIRDGDDRFEWGRAVQFWMLALSDLLDAELSDERCIEFYDFMVGCNADQIDIICCHLLKNCVYWPIAADIEIAKKQYRASIERLIKDVDLAEENS